MSEENDCFECTDEWDCWEDEPEIEDKVIIPVSKEFLGMLKAHDQELVAMYQSVGPCYEPNVTPVKKTAIAMTKRDHNVVDALVAELHPELLEALRTLFVPSKCGDIFDMTLQENQQRHAFLNCFEPEAAVGVNYKPDLLYHAPYTIMGEEIVVNSDVALDHLEYVAVNYPKLIWEFYIQVRSHLRNTADRKNLKDTLRIFRAGRRVSKALNKFTKVSQLSYIDYDNPFFWFDLDAEDLSPEDIVLLGPMPYQVRSRYGRSVYDPGVVGVYSDKVVLANAVAGDESGTYSVDVDLLSRIYLNCKECIVYCHTVPVDFEPPLAVVRKPRPHNLTAIVQLGEYDRTLKGRFKKQFCSSNKWRNERYFGVCAASPQLRQYGTVDYVYDRVVQCSGIVTEQPVKVLKKKKRTRQYETRDLMLHRYSHDPKFRFGDRTFKILGKPQRGALLVDIPHWGDAHLVMNSLRKRAVDYKFQVEFSAGAWCIV